MKTKICPDCKKTLPLDKFYCRKSGNGYKPYCKFCFSKRAKQWRNENIEHHKEYQRNNKLKKNYGITLDDYDEMLFEQGGKCVICGISENYLKRNLDVDHDHKTGKVRGLLCIKCNTTLGWYESFKDQIDRYLKLNK